MMMKAAPAPALEMIEPELVLELLIVALDAPTQLGEADEVGDGRGLRQGREPIFLGLGFAPRPLDQQPLGPPGLRTRSRAKRERIAPRVPSRHVTVRHAVVGRAPASCLRLCGVCLAVRRTCVGGRPRPFQRFGGRGASPGGQAVVSFFTPTTYASPAVVSASRNAVVSP